MLLSAMPEELSDTRSQVDECVAPLKVKILQAEHGALDSRFEELLNHPSADADDVTSILRQEFDPDHG